jgi:YceI-like domain
MTFYRLIFSGLLLLTTIDFSFAQRFMAEHGLITFYSKAPVENIESGNENVTSIFTTSTGSVAFSVPIRDFHFEKKLMEQHFNEKYMESNRFPRSTFVGFITGYSMDMVGQQNVKAKGKLTIHGIVKEIDVPGTFEVKGDQVLMRAKFKVKMEDYGIKIPQLLWKNISEEVEITVDLTFNPK